MAAQDIDGYLRLEIRGGSIGPLDRQLCLGYLTQTGLWNEGSMGLRKTTRGRRPRGGGDQRVAKAIGRFEHEPKDRPQQPAATPK